MYAGMGGTTDDEIRALFGHAQAADALTIKGRGLYSPLTKTVGETAEESGLNHLGTTDYISPQHTDNDVDISVCMQFEKNCLSDEFNFSYTEWGVYIEIMENCLWLFYSSHLHGTIMPHLSTLKAKNAHGDQETGHTSGSDISQSNAEQGFGGLNLVQI
ncbi:hypothetical protein L208DRAFT_1378937 [Tricholoma matsutake]|nr:hypothetical protein L208DRAFT_1378937 [Tricholoma matsutake 945]